MTLATWICGACPAVVIRCRTMADFAAFVALIRGDTPVEEIRAQIARLDDAAQRLDAAQKGVPDG